VLSFASSQDGTYTLNVTRLLQDASLFTPACDSVSGVVAASFSLTPAFTAGVFASSLLVSAEWRACALSATYATAGSVTLGYPAQSYSAFAPASGLYSPTKMTLPVGASSQATAASTMDGLYTLTIVRGAWDVTALGLQLGSGANGLSGLASAAYAPTFASGVVSGYSYLTRYATTGCEVSATFGHAATVAFNGGAPQTLTSGGAQWSPVYLLPVGTTNVLVDSALDSAYALSIVRAPPTPIAARGSNADGSLTALLTVDRSLPSCPAW
jgi:hypothetical protein